MRQDFGISAMGSDPMAKFLATLNCCLRQYSSSVRIAGRGRFLAVRAELNEETIMSFRNERFMQKFLSLDLLGKDDNAEKWSVLSDGGRGADAIRDSLDLKEIQGEEEHNADERQKRVQDRLDKIRETILNANLKEIKHGAKNLKSSYNNEKREQQQKEGLLRLFDVMRKTGADRDKTIVRLSKGYKLKKSSAERFYDRGLAMIKVLLNP